jgi:hypothetical protein
MTTLDELDARVSALEANAASAGAFLTPRQHTEQEEGELRAAYPGGADETYRVTLTYRDVPTASEWFDSIFAVYGVPGPNLGSLPHNVLQSIPAYANVSGPWPLKAPQAPEGSTTATTDPTEILQRAYKGADWAGNPPCSSTELASRTTTRDKVLSGVSGAQPDWYKASKDGLTVLTMGSGYQPYAYSLYPATPYPCPGQYTLDEVCAYLTGGGTPG